MRFTTTRPTSLLMTPMSCDEKAFCKALGVRIAELRKARDLTQVQLAELLELSQQMVASYEVGRRRVPAALLPKLARVLGSSLDDLIGEAPAPAKRGPTPRLQRQMERIQLLPKARQRFVMQVIDTVLSQPGD